LLVTSSFYRLECRPLPVHYRRWFFVCGCWFIVIKRSHLYGSVPVPQSLRASDVTWRATSCKPLRRVSGVNSSVEGKEEGIGEKGVSVGSDTRTDSSLGPVTSARLVGKTRRLRRVRGTSGGEIYGRKLHGTRRNILELDSPWNSFG
jgi:hypothetical protein